MSTSSPSSLGESRDSFFARIRTALGRPADQAIAPAPAVNEFIARLASPQDDLLAKFEKGATAVGMFVHRTTRASAAEQVLRILSELNAKRIALAAGEAGESLSLRAAAENAGLTITDWQQSPGFEIQYDLDAGITDVHAALAETGTLICASDATHTRGLSLVPPAHLALVRRSDVLPDMIDYWARFKGVTNTDLPSSQAFITGPSKTADIEGVLITGVHGPAAVHIILIEDL